MKSASNGLKYLVQFILLFCFITVANAEDGDYVHYRLGVKYKNQNKLDQAIEEFKKVLGAYPDNYNAYMHLSEIREKQGRMRLSIYNLKKALSYNPGWSKAQKALAAAYRKDGQYQNSIKEYQDYLQYCDPGERDSIQGLISDVTKVLKSGGVIDKKDEDVKKEDNVDSATLEIKTEEAEKSVKKESTSTDTKVVKKSTSKKSESSVKVDNVEADREFRMGISAYNQAINTGNSSLFDKAINHLRKTLKMDPGHSGAYYYAGLIRRRLGQNKMAMINFEKATDYPELGYNAHFYLGKIYGEMKEYKKAVKHLEFYIPKTDYDPGKREANALIEKYRAAYKAATQDTIPVVDLKKLSSEEMHREMSMIPQKEELAAIEVRIDSLLTLSLVDTITDPGQAMLAGVHSFQSKNWDKAIEDFKKVLLKYPKGDIAARTLYDIGVCYMKLKNYPAAEDKFQQVLNRYAGHSLTPEALFLKGVALSEKKEDAKAEKVFRKYIQKNRSHKWAGKAYEKLGDIYVDLMQDKNAVDAYSNAVNIAKNPLDGVYAGYKLGESYERLKNIPRANTSFGNAIKLGEKSGVAERVPDSYYKIADNYYRTKDYEKALEYYKKVSRKYKDFQDTPWAFFQIGSIYKKQKKYEEAIKSFKDLIKNYPDDYWARQAKWKLEDTIWEYEYRSVLN